MDDSSLERPHQNHDNEWKMLRKPTVTVLVNTNTPDNRVNRDTGTLCTCSYSRDQVAVNRFLHMVDQKSDFCLSSSESESSLGSAHVRGTSVLHKPGFSYSREVDCNLVTEVLVNTLMEMMKVFSLENWKLC